jgi:hypothetical protein
LFAATERGPGRIVAAGAALAVAGIGVTLFAAYGVPALRAAAERRVDLANDGPLTVGFSHIPSWLDPSVARDIAIDAEQALVGAGSSPFDAAPLALVRERLDRSGWPTSSSASRSPWSAGKARTIWSAPARNACRSRSWPAVRDPPGFRS